MSWQLQKTRRWRAAVPYHRENRDLSLECRAQKLFVRYLQDLPWYLVGKLINCSRKVGFYHFDIEKRRAYVPKPGVFPWIFSFVFDLLLRMLDYEKNY